MQWSWQGKVHDTFVHSHWTHMSTFWCIVASIPHVDAFLNYEVSKGKQLRGDCLHECETNACMPMQQCVRMIKVIN